MMAPTGNVIQIRGSMEKIMDMFEAGSSYADIAKAVGKTERDIEVIIHYIYRQYRMLLGSHGNIWENRTLFKKAKINIEQL